jgi:hypothetical protein
MAFRSAPSAPFSEAIADLAAIFALPARRGRDLRIGQNRTVKKRGARLKGGAGRAQRRTSIGSRMPAATDWLKWPEGRMIVRSIASQRSGRIVHR